MLGSGFSYDAGNEAVYFEFSDLLGPQNSVTSYFFPSQFDGTSSSGNLSAQITWDGTAFTSAGVFFRTKANAEQQNQIYIAPGVSLQITAAGPGVAPTQSFSSLSNPITVFTGQTLIPNAFSAYTSDPSVSGRYYWTRVKAPVKGWDDDPLPRMAGMSYESELVAVKALSSSGTGNISDIVRGLEYISSVAANENIVAVNLSFSIGGGIYSAVIDAAVHNLIAQGIAVVVSAGNDQENDTYVSSPGVEPTAITAVSYTHLTLPTKRIV